MGKRLAKSRKRDATRCQRVDCNRPAKFRPGLRIWAEGTPPDQRTIGNGANMLIGVEVCDQCGNRLTVDDVVSPDGWDQLLAAFRQAGAAKPDRGTLVIYLDPIG